MNLAAVLLLLAGWSAILVLAPQGLAVEIAGAGAGASRRRRAAGIAALTLLGAALVLAPSTDLAARTALALCVQCAAALAWLDVRWLVIPDLYAAAWLAPALVGPLAQPWPSAAAGAALGGGLLWGVRAAWRWRSGTEGLGFGDVKLAAALGALLGPEAIAQVICISALAGAAALLSGRRRAAPPQVAPLGACLALVGVAHLAWTRTFP